MFHISSRGYWGKKKNCHVTKLINFAIHLSDIHSQIFLLFTFPLFNFSYWLPYIGRMRWIISFTFIVLGKQKFIILDIMESYCSDSVHVWHVCLSGHSNKLIVDTKVGRRKDLCLHDLLTKPTVFFGKGVWEMALVTLRSSGWEATDKGVELLGPLSTSYWFVLWPGANHLNSPFKDFPWSLSWKEVSLVSVLLLTPVVLFSVFL